MDVPEDAELHLQRASADLLSDFSSSLPRFLWLSPNVGQQSEGEQGLLFARKAVKERSTEQLIKLVCPIPIRYNYVRIVNHNSSSLYIVGAFSGMASTAGSSSQSFHTSSQFCFP